MVDVLNPPAIIRTMTDIASVLKELKTESAQYRHRNRMQVEAAIKLGYLLEKLQDLLPHGQWGSKLQELSISRKYADFWRAVILLPQPALAEAESLEDLQQLLITNGLQSPRKIQTPAPDTNGAKVANEPDDEEFDTGPPPDFGPSQTPPAPAQAPPASLPDPDQTMPTKHKPETVKESGRSPEDRRYWCETCLKNNAQRPGCIECTIRRGQVTGRKPEAAPAAAPSTNGVAIPTVHTWYSTFGPTGRMLSAIAQLMGENPAYPKDERLVAVQKLQKQTMEQGAELVKALEKEHHG